MIGTELRGATWHAYRYGEPFIHECALHGVAMLSMTCYHCSEPGQCSHLFFQRCRCKQNIVCAECLFEAEGGYL